ncbi:metalloregulator ArsR/SmtB family transcription factor [Cronobacter dublinensis]
MTSFTPLQLFKLLADDTRLHLTLLLRTQGELYVCELSATLNLSQPRISRHLALLRDSGLLCDRRDGKCIHYRLSPHMPAWAAAVIEQAFLCQRESIASLVTQSASHGKRCS